MLKSVGEAITQLPADFTPHRQIKKIYEARREMVETGKLGGQLRSGGVGVLGLCMSAILAVLVR